MTTDTLPENSYLIYARSTVYQTDDPMNTPHWQSLIKMARSWLLSGVARAKLARYCRGSSPEQGANIASPV